MKWIIYKCPDCKERWPVRDQEVTETKVINSEQFCPNCNQFGIPQEEHETVAK